VRRIVGLLAGVVVTTALCGCSSGASPSPSAVPLATRGPSAPATAPSPSIGPTVQAPTPRSTSWAVTYGKAAVTAGDLDCTFGGNGTICDATSNDPRVSGTLTETVEADGWGPIRCTVSGCGRVRPGS